MTGIEFKKKKCISLDITFRSTFVISVMIGKNVCVNSWIEIQFYLTVISLFTNLAGYARVKT